MQVITFSPHYPKSNGQAESGVKIAKSFLKKQLDLDVALLNYRNTEITNIGYSPSQLLMNRKLRTLIPTAQKLLHNNNVNRKQVHSKLVDKQNRFKADYDRKVKKYPQFKVNQKVTFKKGSTWVPAEIIEKCKEPRSYLLKDNNGQVLRRNTSQIRQSSIRQEEKPAHTYMSDDEIIEDESLNYEGMQKGEVSNQLNDVEEAGENEIGSDLTVTDRSDSSLRNEDINVRPKRSTRPNSRLKDFVTSFK
ncbi:hypothetical protein ALC57_04996 [Trachymyrmex cornetzi]|uniref:Integrase catalytic domain-containing protein n=1 Tax=Trachymyrmex cornetzi TaxID=471704 RepID=A0A151JBY2_9HYME|nr:hypothetical protein ALC57_04996 [Trachymyrmex cornetzi]